MVVEGCPVVRVGYGADGSIQRMFAGMVGFTTSGYAEKVSVNDKRTGLYGEVLCLQ